jgi:hypothetical protein
MGTENEFCCFYLIHCDKEYLLVTSQQYLDEIAPQLDSPLTINKTTLWDFMKEERLNNGTTFNYIAGFYISRSNRKMNSCVNYLTTGRTREVFKEHQEKLNEMVLPVIDDYIETITTKCLGTNSKGRNCGRLVKDGRYCFHHR